jgi:hypothetical protein
MVSLVLAIGVTHLVQGVADLIRLRDKIRFEPLPFIWAASLFLVAAIYWWSLWDLRSTDWRFPTFFYLLLAPALLHVAASLLVATDAGEADATMRSEFERIRLPFMLVMAVFSVVVMLDGWIVGAETAWTTYRPVQIWTTSLYLAGALFAGVAAQRIIAGLVLATYALAGFVLRFLPGAFGS